MNEFENTCYCSKLKIEKIAKNVKLKTYRCIKVCVVQYRSNQNSLI